MNKVAIFVPLRTAALALALTGAGCATMGPAPDGPVQGAASADGSSHAERVFRYQSRMADALLDEYPLIEVFEQADPRIVAAEARMNEACSYLTQAVLANVEGRTPSLGLRFKVMTTVGDCERAARRVDRLLNAPEAGAI